MSEIEKYIAIVFNVEEQYVSEIASIFQEQIVPKNTFLLRAGRLPQFDGLSFVKEGIFRIYALKGDKEVTQWVATAGSFVADLPSFLFRIKTRWNIQALVPSVVYTVSFDNYKRLSTSIPNWSELEKKFIVHCFENLENRVFSFLSMDAEERYSMLFASNPQLFNQVSLQYLASMLGMSPETLSRIRAKQNS